LKVQQTKHANKNLAKRLTAIGVENVKIELARKLNIIPAKYPDIFAAYRPTLKCIKVKIITAVTAVFAKPTMAYLIIWLLKKRLTITITFRKFYEFYHS
jgi:hypothetical protein